MKSKIKRIAWGVAIPLIVTGFALLLWKGPWWFDGAHLRHHNLEPADGVVITGFRTALVALGAGIVAGMGLYYTHGNLEHTRRKDREQADLAREGHVTDRYVEAIKLLASESLTEQLGGIYSLERIMRDSERDHATVVEVLAAFIRNHAGWVPPRRKVVKHLPPSLRHIEHRPLEQVQGALTVLGRRPERPDKEHRCDLSRTDLRGARLGGAALQGVNLAQSHLESADLNFADLSGAYLAGAYLAQANMVAATLSGASLDGADLSGTDLSGATMEQTELKHCNLRMATGVTVDQIVKAKIYESTRLPSHLVNEPRIKARILDSRGSYL
ncbi:pentapeptide repeat-containing protein [Streptomyces lincolnensis]|uniref:pentapeptide repeat-containing protein n=1 Tax=Streptomyces lincolnensis TaxID=1915 RepID=UPI001E4FB275|nr:pentapeptide repeat-containing protein [Streptomyces lincolnensis]MCD7437292.1 pentapeptide repeat-containing protein [Streptomyces lincolnensis]